MSRYVRIQRRGGRGPLTWLTAVATVMAFAFPFVGTAGATHEQDPAGSNAVDVIDLSPPTHSAPSGTCNQYTITAYENTTNTVHPAEGETVDIRATQQDSDNIQDVKIAFCDPDGSGQGSDLSGPRPAFGSQTGGGGVTTGDCDDENNVPNNDPGVAGCNNQTGPEALAIVHEECVTASNGTCVFGLTSNEPGTMNITACYESSSANNECTGEPVNDTAVKTWTAGGAEAARGITCSPPSDTNPEGSSHTFQCTVTDANNQPLGGVTVTFDVTAGPNAEEWSQTTCGPTNNAGQTPVGPSPSPSPTSGTPGPTPTGTPGQANSSCTYTDNTSNTSTAVDSPPGTDTVTFWVQQQAGGTIGPDTTEPKTTATKTWSGTARTLDCEPETATNAPGTSHTVTCTARDAAANPVSGVVVRFSETGPGRFSTPAGCNENPASTACDLTTASNGQVQAVVTSASNELGDQTITGTIIGSNPPGAATECARGPNDPAGAPAGACSDSVTKTWANPTPTPPTEVRHARGVQIGSFAHVRIPGKRTRGLVVKGRVSTIDGFEGCHSAVPVKIQIRVGGRWITRKTDVTNDNGAFRVLVRDVRASYRVVAPKFQVDDTTNNQIHICQRAADVARHRH